MPREREKQILTDGKSRTKPSVRGIDYFFFVRIHEGSRSDYMHYINRSWRKTTNSLSFSRRRRLLMSDVDEKEMECKFRWSSSSSIETRLEEHWIDQSTAQRKNKPSTLCLSWANFSVSWSSSSSSRVFFEVRLEFVHQSFLMKKLLLRYVHVLTRAREEIPSVAHSDVGESDRLGQSLLIHTHHPRAPSLISNWILLFFRLDIIWMICDFLKN